MKTKPKEFSEPVEDKFRNAWVAHAIGDDGYEYKCTFPERPSLIECLAAWDQGYFDPV